MKIEKGWFCCTVEVPFFVAGHRVDKQVTSIDFQKIS